MDLRIIVILCSFFGFLILHELLMDGVGEHRRQNSYYSPHITMAGEIPILKVHRKEEKGSGTSECLWTCGADPYDMNSCIASVYRNGLLARSEKRPHKAYTCTAEVCSEVFGDYGTDCPTFEYH